MKGTGNTKIELDGQNVLDSSACEYWAGLNKKGNGNLTITDETSDTGETITAKEETETSGSLRAEADGTVEQPLAETSAKPRIISPSKDMQR